jgi:hypothetical protein
VGFLNTELEVMSFFKLLLLMGRTKRTRIELSVKMPKLSGNLKSPQRISETAETAENRVCQIICPCVWSKPLKVCEIGMNTKVQVQ